MPDFGYDDWMDAQLRNVPVPHDLHKRLSASRPPNDEEIDEWLRDVEVPPHLARRLFRIARQNRGLPGWGRFGLAASVLVAVAAGALFALRGGSNGSNALVADQQGENSRATAGPADDLPRVVNQRRAIHSDSPAPSRRQRPITVPLGPSGQLAQDDPQQQLPFSLQDVGRVGSTIQQAFESKLREKAALGASVAVEPLPELVAYERPPARGVSPPRQRGYDMLFQLKHDEHPFVAPQAHRELRESQLPLTTCTTSYDLAAASIDAGQLPEPDAIRVEDFLAAQRYALPPAPAGQLALHVAASPAPLGAAGLHRLQVAVQGGPAHQRPRAAVRLIAVVDTSSAMRFQARWKTVERALALLSQQLGPDDRLTLIGFAAEPQVLAENATRAELDALLKAGVLRKTTGLADFVSAIQSACDAVRAVPSHEARRVVFVTTGRAEFDEPQLVRSSESLLQLVADNIPWQIIRMVPGDPQAHWSDLARRAHGRTSSVASSDELAAELVECLSGQSQTIAQEMTLRVTFNPRVVTSYRLLGHESTTLTGAAGDPLEIDLRAGQTVTGMYELWVKPSGEGELAIVELRWRDPRNGQPRRSVQPVVRSDVASSFSRAPGWLQHGILAASAAEFLRASYFVPNSQRLDQLVDLSLDVPPETAQQAEFRSLVRLIQAADSLR